MDITGLAERLHLPYLSLGGLIVLVNLYLFALYQSLAKAEPSTSRRWGPSWLEFSAEDLGAFSYRQLALASIAGLFLELLMIRWISSEIRVFAYFKNFVLIACFLGFGLGCYLSGKRIKAAALFLPLLTLALVVKFPWEDWHVLLRSLPSLVGALSEVEVRGVPSLPRTPSELLGLVKTMAIVVPLFGLIAFCFLPIGQLVGWYLEKAPKGIKGYSINILGSLVGILLYTGLCFINQPPSVWFVAAGALLLWLFWRFAPLRWAAMAVFVVCVALTALAPRDGSHIFWSPYQKLTMRPIYESGELISYELNTNDSWYQQMFNLSPQFIASHPQFFRQVAPDWNPYNMPYRFFPNPNSVLVLGAGTGNDVAAALRNGAKRVVAVEIDPLILRLGRELHFERPYSSPHVQVEVNDARSYLENGREQFDVIMFSLLDSHTTSSYYSNIRIDNYVYTLEALQAARKLLKPDGLLFLKFYVETPWIAGRLQELTQSIFGRPPLGMLVDTPFYSSAGHFFICGSAERLNAVLADPVLAAYIAQRQHFPIETATATTDNWPYFYQHEPGLPSAVIVVSLVLLGLGWLFLRETGVSVASLDLHLFFLGAGFLLLEAQIISKMALLFGTTWVVNSIVISGLLLLIVGSNVIVDWKPDVSFAIGYAGIFASMLASYSIPIERFFFASLWLKALVATAVLCLPVFFAGIVFIKSFARARFQGSALGSNLLGALLGGLLESLSFWTGIRSLLVLAALLYLSSLLALLSGSRRSLSVTNRLANVSSSQV